MEKISQKLKSYIETHPFDSGSDDCTTVLDQFYLAYANSHESDPPEIREGFKELEEFLHHLPPNDNNAVCNLCCHLCGEYKHKAFIDGVLYGAHLMKEINWQKLIPASVDAGIVAIRNDSDN